MPIEHDSALKALLEQTRTIAVVGYSNKPNRPSRGVARQLQAWGYTVYAVNPTLDSDGDWIVYPSLSAIPVPVDLVDVFRRAEDVPPVVEEAIAIGAKAIWMQLGIVNAAAAAQAEAAGLQVVMDRCTQIEVLRLQVRPPIG